MFTVNVCRRQCLPSRQFFTFSTMTMREYCILGVLKRTRQMNNYYIFLQCHNGVATTYAASKNNCGECPALRILFCMSKLRNLKKKIWGGDCHSETMLLWKMCYFIIEPFRLLFNWRPTVRPCCTVINLKTAHLAIFSTLYVHAVKKGPCTVKTLN